MYYQIRKDFTISTPPASIREILEENNIPITYREVIIRLSQTPADMTGNNSLIIFTEGQDLSVAPPLQVAGYDYINNVPNQRTLNHGNDPAWLDNTMVGIRSGATETVTLIFTIE